MGYLKLYEEFTAGAIEPFSEEESQILAENGFDVGIDLASIKKDNCILEFRKRDRPSRHEGKFSEFKYSLKDTSGKEIHSAVFDPTTFLKFGANQYWRVFKNCIESALDSIKRYDPKKYANGMLHMGFY
jgi:hypothetical protein